MLFAKQSYVYTEPKGTVLIIGPFNYPVQLTLVPLISAIAAGNTVMLKPSEQSPQTASTIKEMLDEVFPDEYVSVHLGGKALNEELIKLPYDLIFFTGSQKVGKIIMQQASHNLTPVILELGGKSPAVVLHDANLATAAKRIVWGAFLNGGQTCVAPDYVLVEESISNDFLDLVKIEMKTMFASFNYKILDEKRLQSYLNENKDSMIAGGLKDHLIQPTILFGDIKGAILEDEIFGPILPIIPIKNTDSIEGYLQKNPYPLAFYVFTKDLKKAKSMMNRYQFGGGMINDTVLHLVDERIPFGGIRTSGLGSYHGKIGFDAFSHKKSVVISSHRINTPFMYPPYKNKLSWFKKIFF